MIVVFYVSGHGLGHASRQIEVVNELLTLHPPAHVVIRSAVPEWMFGLSLRYPVAVHPVVVDTGITQVDSLRVDEHATIRDAARFYAGFAQRLDEEAAFLQKCRADVVVGDVPPLAFAAAHQAGVRSMAIANFTWDWIYQGFSEFEAGAPGVLNCVSEAYAKTTKALRLPFHGGFAPMTHVTEDIPLIGRASTMSRAEARAALNLSPSIPAVLASFGRYGVSIDYDAAASSNRFALVVVENEASTSTGVTRLSHADLGARSLRYEDVVAACDVVAGKPGYGIVSECVANDTAFLYTSRGRLAEYEVMVEEMPRYLRCRYIDQARLLSGDWDDAVEALLAQPAPCERLRHDGASEAAKRILKFATG
jgi:L-arabinokinase